MKKRIRLYVRVLPFWKPCIAVKDGTEEEFQDAIMATGLVNAFSKRELFDLTWGD